MTSVTRWILATQLLITTQLRMALPEPMRWRDMYGWNIWFEHNTLAYISTVSNPNDTNLSTSILIMKSNPTKSHFIPLYPELLAMEGCSLWFSPPQKNPTISLNISGASELPRLCFSRQLLRDHPGYLLLDLSLSLSIHPSKSNQIKFNLI